MSNGSERTPERCVHAPVGPDLAGLRELPTPKPDYEALIGRLHAVSFGDDWPDVKRLLWYARNAVEALLAEAADARARSKRLRKNRMKERAALVARINDYRAECDALRTQLDSMTVETRTDWKFIPVTARGDEGRSEKVREQRLVGPWTVVEGEQNNGND